MAERLADRVIVPDIVGLPFHIGREHALKAGVALANPDPDGPPIGALAWPGLFFITAQHPPAGTVLFRWNSVAVEIVAFGDATDRAMAPDARRPPSLDAHAEPEREIVPDLDPGGASDRAGPNDRHDDTEPGRS